MAENRPVISTSKCASPKLYRIEDRDLFRLLPSRDRRRAGCRYGSTPGGGVVEVAMPPLPATVKLRLKERGLPGKPPGALPAPRNCAACRHRAARKHEQLAQAALRSRRPRSVIHASIPSRLTLSASHRAAGELAVPAGRVSVQLVGSASSRRGLRRNVRTLALSQQRPNAHSMRGGWSATSA
jgi:hypothetical protein